MESLCFLGLLGGIFSDEGDEIVREGCVGVVPERAIERRYYRCDRKFHSEVVESLCREPENVYGLVHILGQEATLYVVEDRRPRKVDVAGVFIKNRHKKGGQSQNRYQRLNDIQVHEYVRMVAERVREHLSECRHVILAGPGNKKKLVWEELGRSERFELVTCDDDIEKVIEEHLPEDPQAEDVRH